MAVSYFLWYESAAASNGGFKQRCAVTIREKIENNHNLCDKLQEKLDFR